MSPKFRHFAVAIGVLIVDFSSKRIVLARREEFIEGISLIDGILSFTYVRNSGAAFGMFEGGRWPFVVVSVVAAVALGIVLGRGRAHGLRAYAYAMIFAGALGNLVDRLFYDGRVVDFILMSWRGHNFPVYNVADIGVSVGATLLVWTMLREKPEPTPADDERGAS